MKKNLKDIKKQIQPLLNWFRKNYKFVIVVGVLLLYSSLVAYINILNRREPSEDTVTEQLQTIKKPTISQDTINKLSELEDKNVDTKTLFKSARENPFQE